MTLPNIDADDLSVSGTIASVRDVKMYATESPFLFYDNDLATSADVADMLLQSNAGTFIASGGNAVYSVGSGAFSAFVLAPVRLSVAQCAVIAEITAHNAAGTYNDVCVGVAFTSTSTSDVINHRIVAIFRRTAGAPNGYIELQYTHDATFEYLAGPTIVTPLVFPFKLIFLLNHNSIALAVEEDGVQRILHNFEVDIAHWDLEDQTTVGRLRPILYFQSDGGQATTLSDFEVRALGTLGDREHYLVTYESGEPIYDGSGNVYVTADATHVTTRTVDISQLNSLPNSQYMRNQSACRLYNPVSGALGAMTAKYAMTSGTRVFGCQQGAIIHDRRTGLWWQYFAKWNDAGAGIGPIRTYYRSTATSPLTGFNKYTDLTLLDLTGLGQPFLSNDCYDFKPQYYNGRWYGVMTVTGVASTSAAACVSGTSPNTFDTVVFVDDSVHGEGTYFWNIGGVPHVVVGIAGGQDVRILSLAGTFIRNLTVAPAAGRYKLQAALLPRVVSGTTQYQIITFSDPSAGGYGGDYYSSFNDQYQTLTFGPTLVRDAGTFAGEEYADHVDSINSLVPTWPGLYE